jgi:hypothetical protein
MEKTYENANKGYTNSQNLKSSSQPFEIIETHAHTLHWVKH